ncbi:hypothetical protein CJO92_12120 [Ralstonia solanacearum]|uniref:Serine protease n=2 Tax=Ralstonia solanacearum TaxID=305 RepID=A0AAD0S802_RALSL|nr:hypothetical protein CJO77_12120 [Ralstonia solanacearum]AXW53344.1 hypothetical protein CJO92_12120 [Ralstonia solanacearum]
MPTAMEENIVKTAADIHKDALVSFLVKRPNYDRRRSLVGSGFLATSTEPDYVHLYTAAHVIEDYQAAGYGWITIGTQMIELQDVGVREIGKTRDVALWRIPAKYLYLHGIDYIPTFPLYKSDALTNLFIPTCSFMICGYPGSKNKSIDMREGGDRERMLFGLGLHGYEYDVETKELCFHYMGKGQPESWADRQLGAPALGGMSGSPCARFVVHREEKRLGIVVAGVFTRWKGQRELRAEAFPMPWLSKPGRPLREG